ncbi:MAG: insulinase family protein [Oligoflexia bacterium]|nr:insulinase family protein [Oligoflexia bacterium]
MKVLLIQSHKAPVVSVQVWVKTGSADEKKNEEGLSHFIEHLVFKGTQKFGVGQIAQIVEGSGGELNAYTTFDHTVFYVTLSSTEQEVGLEVLSQMMGHPRFDNAEINKEREVVIEEIKRSFDNPSQVASQQIFSTVYKKHPYGIPIIGYDKNIKAVSTKKIAEYYNARYVPSNMCLVVTGDINKNKIKPLIEKYFADFKPNKLKKIKRSKEPKQKKLNYNYKTSDFKEAIVNIAFKVPGAIHKDVPALDLLGIILGYGDSSRLVKRLRLKSPLVSSIASGSYNPLDNGIFIITAHLQMSRIKEVLSAIAEELSLVLKEAVGIEELQSAKLNIESDEIYGLETVDGLARKVGYFQTMAKDPEYVQKYLNLLEKVTPKDVFKVARKYLNPKQMSVSILLDKKESKGFSQKHFFEEILQLKSDLTNALKVKPPKMAKKNISGKKIKVPLSLEKAKHEIEKINLPNGGRLILKQNPEIPLLSIKMGQLGGLRQETKNNNGITTLVSNTWAAGTKNYSEEEIAKLIESHAGSYSCFGGRNSMGVSFDILSPHFNEVETALEDLLLQPTFNFEKIQREAQIQIENIKSKEDNPSSIAIQKFMENIFTGHPYSMDVLGSQEFLRQATTQELLSFFKAQCAAANTTFVAVGDFEKSQIKEFFTRVDSQKPKGEKHTKTFTTELLEKEKNIFIPLKKEQAHIVLGYRGITLSDEKRYILQIIQAILSGQGGRLFLELRDKASLAYTVAPIQLLGIDTGYFGAYIGCSPEKTETAISMLKEEFNKMATFLVDYDELERAKKYLVGQNHIGLQRNSSQASSILFDEIYGIDCVEAFEFYNKIKHIEPSQVIHLAQELFLKPAVTVVVGPNKPKVGF